MSEYSPQEQVAYDFGFRIGKSLGATGVEFNAVSKKKWTSAYRHQIDELTRENEELRAQLAADRERTKMLVDALKEALASSNPEKVIRTALSEREKFQICAKN